MAEAVLKLDDLRELTHLKRPADVRRKLEKDGIVCFGDGEAIWTTYDVIQLAARVKLGLVKPDDEQDSIL